VTFSRHLGPRLVIEFLYNGDYVIQLRNPSIICFKKPSTVFKFSSHYASNSAFTILQIQLSLCFKVSFQYASISAPKSSSHMCFKAHLLCASNLAPQIQLPLCFKSSSHIYSKPHLPYASKATYRMLQIQLPLCPKSSSHMCFKTHLPYKDEGGEGRE